MTKYKYSQDDIHKVYTDNLNMAKAKLAELDVYHKEEQCDINVLNGWIFEHVVRHCLTYELKERGLNPKMSEQYPTIGRRKADLEISNKILIEIKKLGVFYSKENFENTKERYKKYINTMKEKGFIEYLYITLEQSEEPKKPSSWNYREKDIEIFGKDNAFFLDESDDNWRKFVNRVEELLRENQKNRQSLNEGDQMQRMWKTNSGCEL